ncbi:MAG: hypothetical protein JWN25_707 [Verrucomicrobiales bacterium]|jgi:hypothetical protein|nr:hypothetical protein [Verrucomicrobiales bacterium]MDB6130738.1 hypothetical protein [Verrucomicrobiales bacterium]
MTKHHFNLLAKKWARLFHIYISMLGLILIVFFAATGFFLNHADAFNLGKLQTVREKGTLPFVLLTNKIDQAAIEAALRDQFKIKGDLSSFEDERTEIRVTFKGPGRSVEVVIRRKDGQCDITSTTRGVLGRLGELHRGTEAGKAWRLLIDGAALLTMAVTLSGIFLWLVVPKWRRWGIAALVVSATVCAVIYFLLVP